MRPEISIPTVRWIMHLKNGKTLVENHEHGRTWKTCLKDNYQNINALCLQVLPEGVKYYIDPSPFELYWQFEEFDVYTGGGSTHVSRNICSKQDFNKWLVITVTADRKMTQSYMTDKEIGYESLLYIKEN